MTAQWVDLADVLALGNYLRVETYDRDGGHKHPRKRIEVETPADPVLRARFLAIEMPCVHCGAPIHPVRARNGWKTLFLAVTCPLDVTVSCARSNDARDAYVALTDAITKGRT